jgi:hypothetical protein
MATGDMFLLDEPPIPSQLTKPDGAILTIDELLTCKENVWYVTEGDDFKPRLTGPYKVVDVKYCTSPRSIDDGDREYLILTYLTNVSKSYPSVKSFKWMPTKYVFRKIFNSFFTDRSQAEQYVMKLRNVYESDLSFLQWKRKYDIERDNSSRFYRNTRQLRDA